MIKLLSTLAIGLAGLAFFAGEVGREAGNTPSERPTMFATVEVLERGDMEWRPLAETTAAQTSRGCDINFRGSNSGSRTIWVMWRDSQAKITGGWWAKIASGYTAVSPGSSLRKTQEVSTACKRDRRYRFSLVHDSNNNKYGMEAGDRTYTLYKPSASGWYKGGVTTVDLGDLNAPFK
jgi:hypothetical protein